MNRIAKFVVHKGKNIVSHNAKVYMRYSILPKSQDTTMTSEWNMLYVVCMYNSEVDVV